MKFINKVILAIFLSAGFLPITISRWCMPLKFARGCIEDMPESFGEYLFFSKFVSGSGTFGAVSLRNLFIDPFSYWAFLIAVFILYFLISTIARFKQPRKKLK